MALLAQNIWSWMDLFLYLSDHVSDKRSLWGKKVLSNGLIITLKLHQTSGSHAERSRSLSVRHGCRLRGLPILAVWREQSSNGVTIVRWEQHKRRLKA